MPRASVYELDRLRGHPCQGDCVVPKEMGTLCLTWDVQQKFTLNREQDPLGKLSDATDGDDRWDVLILWCALTASPFPYAFCSLPITSRLSRAVRHHRPLLLCAGGHPAVPGTFLTFFTIINEMFLQMIYSPPLLSFPPFLLFGDLLTSALFSLSLPPVSPLLTVISAIYRDGRGPL